jgi:hypothetical protein
VLVGYLLYAGFKAVRWAMTVSYFLDWNMHSQNLLLNPTKDAPTGLEGMPQFSTSLGCLNAPYIYNSSEVHISIPLATRSGSSSFDVRGGSVGTITIADADAGATEIKYEITIRATQEDLLQKLNIVYPDANADGSITRSRLILDTPSIIDETQCMRYDVKMYLPANLKKMHVQAHAVAHAQFAPGTRGGASMEQLKVTLYALNQNNLLVPSAEVAVQNLQLEVYRGWLVGEAQIVDNLSIETQRWDAVANVKIAPAPPADPAHPSKAMLRTATGAGRADFVYLGSNAFIRPIQAMHTSSRNADMYLTYRGSGFNGKIGMDSKSYTMTGAQKFKASMMRRDEESTPSQWTHFYGDPDGGDEITVNSRGWTGLYF